VFPPSGNLFHPAFSFPGTTERAISPNFFFFFCSSAAWPLSLFSRFFFAGGPVTFTSPHSHPLSCWPSSFFFFLFVHPVLPPCTPPEGRASVCFSLSRKKFCLGPWPFSALSLGLILPMASRFSSVVLPGFPLEVPLKR